MSLFVGSIARADDAVLRPDKDNTLYQFDPDQGDFPLSNGAGDYMFAGETGRASIRRALIHFDVAAEIPMGSTINSVRLQIYMSRSNAGDTSVSLHRVLADWGEGSTFGFGGEGGGGFALPGDATWFNRFEPGMPWAHPGGDFSAVESDSETIGSEDFYTFSSSGMASDVQAWLDNPSNAFGWIIIGDESMDHSAKRFNTRTNPDESTRPVLKVDFTPPPSCIGDYNMDGGIDGSDVSAFFNDWEAGNFAADVNQDGGIDGADVAFFFEHWEAGC